MTKPSGSQTDELQKPIMPPEPKQPLTTYNLFFQLERKRILEGTDHLNTPLTEEEIRRVSLEHKLKGKRQHRKSHGKISFRELARTIANRWKQLPMEARNLLSEQAVVEKELYNKAYKEWVELTSKCSERLQNDGSDVPQQDTRLGPTNNMHMTFGHMQGSNATTSPELLMALESLRNKVEAELSRLSSSATHSSQAALQHAQPVSPSSMQGIEQVKYSPFSQCSTSPIRSSLLPEDWNGEDDHVREQLSGMYGGQNVPQGSVARAKPFDCAEHQDALSTIPLAMIAGHRYLVCAWDPKVMDMLFMDN